MPETCPSCGATADGRFCNACGAALSAACRECGNPLPRGARFCNECGAAAAAQPATAAPASRHLLPWAVAAGAVLALIVVLLWPRRTAVEQTPSGPPATFSGPTATPNAAPGTAPGTPPDISQMTPQERADRLFNRVMEANANGDSAQAARFAPMAIQAYGMLPRRTSDDHYHIAALQLVTRDAPGARAQADTVLADNPRHLLMLFTAAQAAQMQGQDADSKQLLTRFLEAYPAESVRRDVPEYQDHAQALPIMREAAQRLSRTP
jgi:hypothetical protein